MANPLIGVWRLITVEDYQADGTILYPYGERALGYLIYHPEGYMSATVMSAERPRLAKQSRPWELSPDEAAAVLQTMGSAYSGVWELRDESTVIHHVHAALIPNMIGQDEVRPFELKGDRLYVYTLRPPTKTCAIWERAENLTGAITG
ncbi:MAG TPA: lipocalin-like domain-containing protein [Dehalococcoidia bacterium]|nr:lipocalin-like domain-containing protein [Dehalococcoidia bacterium]